MNSNNNDKSELMDLTPDENDLWSVMGGYLETFIQGLWELLDDAISNYQANKPANNLILITIESEVDNKILVKVEDGGTGIKNIKSALTLGRKDCRETNMNEHGAGINQALPFFNPNNNSWAIYTRTIDILNKGQYRCYKAPYKFKKNCDIISDTQSKWPGQFQGTGTIIEFTCSQEVFKTIQEPINVVMSNENLSDLLCEHIGYWFSGKITSGIVNLRVVSSSFSFNKLVSPQLPPWSNLKVKYNDKINSWEECSGKKRICLTGKEAIIDYKFGEIEKGNGKVYYQRNMATSGVELRINGRLLKNNILEEVWGITNHPHYNAFIGYINIITPDDVRIFNTKVDKTGINTNDKALSQLYQEIKLLLPKLPRSDRNKKNQKQLCDQLKKIKEVHSETLLKCEREYKLFKSLNLNVKADLELEYQDGGVVIYETKTTKAELIHLYQLNMYWDGCVIDNVSVKKAILVANDYSKEILDVLKELNKRKDSIGNYYNFEIKTWSDEMIEIS
jgi:hypothetical protein